VAEKHQKKTERPQRGKMTKQQLLRDKGQEVIKVTKGQRLPEKSDSNLIFAGSVLVFGREQLLL